MSQTLPATAILGPAKTGLGIGYRVLNLNRTTYSAFTTTNVAESPASSGTYNVSGGIVAPDAGGYVVFGVSGTDYAEAPIDPAPPTVAAIQSGLASESTLAIVGTNVSAILDNTSTSGVILSTSQMQALADIVLGRGVSHAEGFAETHSIAELILAILESSTASGLWVIKRTDGSTTFNTRTLATDANAIPIVGVS
mgnify:CR=1 FL=1